MNHDIVACQAHPAVVKLGLACLFHFNSLLVCTCLVWVLRTLCVCHKRLVVQQVRGSLLVSGLVHLCTD